MPCLTCGEDEEKEEEEVVGLLALRPPQVHGRFLRLALLYVER